MLELADPPVHQKAWERFEKLGYPTKRSEVYRYVRLRDLYKHTYCSPTIFTHSFEPKAGTLVIVNGRYSEALSRPPKPLIALPLSKAFSVYGNFLKGRENKLLQEEKDPFAALNMAYAQEGLFLYLPPKSICEHPVHIVHLIDPVQAPTLICPRIHLFAGQQSALKLNFSHQTLSENIWVNALIDFSLDERAAVTFSNVSAQQANSHCFLNVRASCKKQSAFKTVSATNGGGTSREDYLVHLIGEECDAALQGAWGIRESSQHHVNVLMEHHEPNCTSLQKFKGTLFDHARSSFEGKIYVHQKAQKTNAYQMNHNLLFGEHASANSKPNLEIFADDVKASHGCTIGSLDKEQLFYLTTRGIPQEMACTLLVQGFIREILDQIEDPTLKNQALELLL